jgi:peptidyl-tRNA hydrolase, PTH1 family
MKIIIGLGNPGLEYENTRHNIGFSVINYFPGNKKWQEGFKAQYCELNILGNKVILVKPQTYMNLSGDAVRLITDYYKVTSDNILVIQDDLDLPVGKYRLKYQSSCGGHNGLRSIINNLNTDKIPRLKIGIGSNDLIDTKDYVLGKFSKEENATLKSNMDIFVNIITDFVNNNIDYCMQKYNKK